MFIDGNAAQPAYAGPGRAYDAPPQRSGSSFWGSLFKGAAVVTGLSLLSRMFMPFGCGMYNPFMFGCGMPWGSMMFNPLMSFGSGALLTGMLCGGF
jgi:hypothetical protein